MDTPPSPQPGGSSLHQLGDRILSQFEEYARTGLGILDDETDEEMDLEMEMGYSLPATPTPSAQSAYPGDASQIEAADQSTPSEKGRRANRRKRERENKRNRGELAPINHRNKQKVQHKREHNTEVDISDTNVSAIKVAKTGRQGVRAVHPSLAEWEYLSLAERQQLLAPLRVVPQEQKKVFKAATSDGRVLVVRTYPDHRLSTEEWNQGFFESVKKLHASVRQNSTLPAGRSGHGSLPFGFLHSNGNNNKRPYKPAIYTNNEGAYCEFEQGEHWHDILNSLKALFEEHGGDMPAKSTQVSEEWAKKTNGEVYTPFPYYFTGWINLPPHDGQRVICIPHKDWKNVAAFWCAVFCFGLFSRNQAVFLVIWELQIILEFLPGGWIFLPSAMLTHLNVDAATLAEKIQVVTTAAGEQPTPASAPFRGSVTFFNPASFFAVSGTKHFTIKQAVAAGDEHLLCTDFAKMAKIFPQTA